MKMSMFKGPEGRPLNVRPGMPWVAIPAERV
jgi:hypothetical protein